MNTEFWIRSKSYPKHDVSNTGKVRVAESSKPSNIGRILKQKTDKDGYKSVAINRTTVRVHRLVAEAFIPNPKNSEVVHHKDNVKHNNDASNLEWATISYNTRHAHYSGTLKSHTAKPLNISINGEVVATYRSGTACAESVGVPRRAVEKCMKEGTDLLGFIELEEVDEISHNRTTPLFSVKFPRKSSSNPIRIVFDDGSDLVVSGAPELSSVWGIHITQAYRIIKGQSWERRGIKEIKDISMGEFLIPHLVK